MIGTADVCLRRLQYDIETPRDVYHSGSVRALGVAYHAGCEFYYLARMERGEIAPDLAKIREFAKAAFYGETVKAGEHFTWDDNVPTQEDAYKALDLMLTNYFTHPSAVWNSDWEVLGVETEFEFPTDHPDDVHTGTIDLTVRHKPTGGIVVDDQKTAGKKWPANKQDPRKHPQPPFYVAAAQRLWPDGTSYQFSFSIMTYKGDFERRVSPVSDRHIAAVMDRGTQIASLYRGMRNNGLELPPNPTSFLCSSKWCDFYTICPFGADLES